MHSFCGACANRFCSCCLKISSPLVLVICLMECGARHTLANPQAASAVPVPVASSSLTPMHTRGAALGLAILFDWTAVDTYLDKIDSEINKTGSEAGNDLVAEEEQAYPVRAKNLSVSIAAKPATS